MYGVPPPHVVLERRELERLESYLPGGRAWWQCTIAAAVLGACAAIAAAATVAAVLGAWPA